MRSIAGKSLPISKGTRILSSKPFVYILNQKFQGSLCDCCLKCEKQLFRCTGCLFVYYCGKACQRTAWADHKAECSNLKRVRPKTPPDAVRFIARIILKLKRGGDMEEELITETRSRRFKDLMSHYKELKEDAKRMEHFASIVGVLKEYLGEGDLPNGAEVMGIYGRVCVNSFNIVNGEMQTIGTGIYLAVSIIDHSCEPNAVATFDGTTLNIQTTRDLPRLDWDEIRISYIDLMNSKEDRRRELKDRYYFDCDCPRCRGEDVDGFTYAAKCPSCEEAIVLKKSECRPCSSCGSSLTPVQWVQFWEAIDFTAEQFQALQEINYLDICELCLRKQGSLFHNLCLYKAKVLDAAFEAAIQLQLWDKALGYGGSLIECSRFWYGKYHPLLAIHLLKMGKISLHENKNQQALVYLEEAYSILQVTHGRANSFVMEECLPLLMQAKAGLAQVN